LSTLKAAKSMPRVISLTTTAMSWIKRNRKSSASVCLKRTGTFPRFSALGLWEKTRMIHSLNWWVRSRIWSACRKWRRLLSRIPDFRKKWRDAWKRTMRDFRRRLTRLLKETVAIMKRMMMVCSWRSSKSWLTVVLLIKTEHELGDCLMEEIPQLIAWWRTHQATTMLSIRDLSKLRMSKMQLKET